MQARREARRARGGARRRADADGHDRRWATRGGRRTARRPIENAHPHTDCSGHDRRDPQRHRREPPGAARGAREGGAHLRLRDRHGGRRASASRRAGGDGLTAAVRSVVARLRGAYSLVVVSSDHPGEMVGVKVSSPLVVGLGTGETIIASDIPAVLARTRAVVPCRRDRSPRSGPTGSPSPTWRVAPSTSSRCRSTGTSPPPRSRATTGSCARRSTSSPMRSATRWSAARGRAAPAGRAADPRRRAARGLEGLRRRVRDGLPLGARREVRDRALDAPAGRDRDRERVPLPRSGPRARHVDARGLAVGRDDRHAGSGAARAAAGLPGDRRDQHRRIIARARSRRRAVHPRGA